MIIVELTDEQAAQVSPLFAKLEYYGMVIGRVGHFYDSEKVHAEIGVISRTKAKKIAEIMSEEEPKESTHA